MTNEQFSTTLRSLIEQYGIPSPESIPRYKSFLQDVFVDHPREMNLLILGLDEGIPGQLQAKKGTVPYEIISGQLTDRLYNNRGMDRQAAEWVVRTWAEALGYDIVKVVQKPKEEPPTRPLFEKNQTKNCKNNSTIKKTPLMVKQSSDDFISEAFGSLANYSTTEYKKNPPMVKQSSDDFISEAFGSLANYPTTESVGINQHTNSNTKKQNQTIINSSIESKNVQNQPKDINSGYSFNFRVFSSWPNLIWTGWWVYVFICGILYATSSIQAMPSRIMGVLGVTISVFFIFGQIFSKSP